MATPLGLLAPLDGGLASLEGLRELYFVMAPTVLLGLVALVLCLFAAVRARASRRFVRIGLFSAGLACAASVACVWRFAGKQGYESVVVWYAVQTALTSAAALGTWTVARRR